MSRSRKFFFYGLMVAMTLAVIEGMAQAAYYIAYGEFNGSFRPSAVLPTGDGDGDADAGPGQGPVEYRPLWFERISHPYYGFTAVRAEDELNRALPPRREDGVVLIGLLGGSVGEGVAPAFRQELQAWFRSNNIPLRPVVLELAHSGMKQPQQVMILANSLTLGGEYDIIVNLDGRNELILPQRNYYGRGRAPFFPLLWENQQQGLTAAQKLLVSRIYALRQREYRLAAVAAARPWRWSAWYGMVNRYLGERTGAQILALNHKLAAPAAAAGEYSLERSGPVWPVESDDAVAPDSDDLSRIALRVWYRGSALLHDLSRAAGAEYYHFLQPNQYVPDSKPLTDRERADAYNPAEHSVELYRGAYPLLLRLGAELRRRGVNYHDLTQVFADNRETLYRDQCCHLNQRGNELLAASMVQRLAPALRRRAALAAMKVGGGGGV